jgi:predicted nucleic-acid-binding Zn-ribbon protein
MPDDAGNLTATEFVLFERWLDSHWRKPHPCPVCGTDGWGTGGQIVVPITMGSNSSLRVGGQIVPQVFVLCHNCGYTMFFNAVLIGLLPGDGASKHG